MIDLKDLRRLVVSEINKAEKQVVKDAHLSIANAKEDEITTLEDRLAFEADTAMGIGIVYLFCLLVFPVENILVDCFLAVWTAREEQKREKKREYR